MSEMPMARRLMSVDIARGGALAMMIAYHFTFDINLLARIGLDFNHDPLWLGLRALIVSLFLLLVGISQSIVHQQGFDRARYLRRLVLLIVCAGLVTLGSRMLFPSSYIFFGILHFIALASVLGLLTVRFYYFNLFSGISLILCGNLYSHAWFDQPAFQWVGLMTHKPLTEDYVPLLPWFGAVQIGQYLGRVLYRLPAAARIRGWSSSVLPLRLLALGGRHSLLIYMVHQPVLLGLLYLYFEF